MFQLGLHVGDGNIGSEFQAFVISTCMVIPQTSLKFLKNIVDLHIYCWYVLMLPSRTIKFVHETIRIMNICYSKLPIVVIQLTIKTIKTITITKYLQFFKLLDKSYNVDCS